MTAHVPNYELRCRLLTGGMLAVAIVAAWLCMVGFWAVGGCVAILLIVAVFGISSQWAFWRPRISGGRPRILMLHSVNERIMEPIAPNNSIRPAELESLIAGLLCAGYVFRTLRDAMEQPGRRVVVLTFDDGFEDNFTQLLPILKRFEVPATLFVTDRRGEDFLSDDQIRNLAASGLIEIGGHTVSHASLTELDEQTLVRELGENRATLQRLSGQKVVSFAYPRGFYGERDRNAVEAVGYRYAVTTKKRLPPGDCLQLPRQIIPRGLTPFRQYLIATRGRAKL